MQEVKYNGKTYTTLDDEVFENLLEDMLYGRERKPNPSIVVELPTNTNFGVLYLW